MTNQAFRIGSYNLPVELIRDIPFVSNPGLINVKDSKDIHKPLRGIIFNHDFKLISY